MDRTNRTRPNVVDDAVDLRLRREGFDANGSPRMSHVAALILAGIDSPSD